MSRLEFFENLKNEFFENFQILSVTFFNFFSKKCFFRKNFKLFGKIFFVNGF